MKSELKIIIDDLIPIFRKTLLGKYAISLAGSYAKGSADENSDIDFFIYTEDVQPYALRKALIEEIADKAGEVYIDESINSEFWGGCMDFSYKGYKIETTLRSTDMVRTVLNECLQGKIKVEPVFWTIHGYYNYIYLSELDFIWPIDDPYSIVYSLKKEIEVYPTALKNSIIDYFWWRGQFWVNNFHYASAIKRKDVFYTSGIIQQTVHNLIQVIFAINEKYFGGDKKIEGQLRSLSFCPKCLIENIDFLLSSYKDTELLNKQKQVLESIITEIGYRL